MKPDSAYPLAPMKTLLGRGWRKKCPRCGEGALYKRWLKLHDRCPVCGLQYLTNQGDLLGALIFLDRALFLIPLVVLLYFHVWNPNMAMFIISAVVISYLLVFTMPNRNGVSLAIDYYLRRTNGELDEDANEVEKK